MEKTAPLVTIMPLMSNSQIIVKSVLLITEVGEAGCTRPSAAKEVDHIRVQPSLLWPFRFGLWDELHGLQ
jgi:hypothetical protein